jgi:hypothetical protein
MVDSGTHTRKPYMVGLNKGVLEVVVLTLCRDETWKKCAGGLESDKEDWIDGGTSTME